MAKLRVKDSELAIEIQSAMIKAKTYNRPNRPKVGRKLASIVNRTLSRQEALQVAINALNAYFC